MSTDLVPPTPEVAPASVAAEAPIEHSPPKGDPAPPVLPADATVGFGPVDSIATACLPAFIQKRAEEPMRVLATDLVREGARGGAARRLLARDIAIRHARLRFMEGLQATLLGRAADSPGVLRQAVEFDRLIESEHRRLVAALDALARCDPSPTTVRITAHQAAVLVGR